MTVDCNKCGKPNRQAAKYCKFCGSPIMSVSAGDELKGKGKVEDMIKEMLSQAQTIDQRGKQRGMRTRAPLSFAITGVAGVGKNFTAQYIATRLFQTGIIKDPNPTIVKSADYNKYVDKLDDNIKKVGGNVLVIDDAQKLSPAGRADSGCDLDKILDKCEDWREECEKPIVMFLGDEDLTSFFENNPSASARVQYHIPVPPPDIDSLAEICRDDLISEGYTVTDEAFEKMKRVLNATKRNGGEKFNFCHAAIKLSFDIRANHPNLPQNTVTPDVVDGEEFIPKTLDDVMAEFDKFVGVDEIKQAIREIAITVEDARQKGKNPIGSVKSHFIFVGNPGTGKTTMARLFAESLSAMGALPSGHLVEVDRGKLVSNYVGDTAKQVRKAVNSAMGGVLFIDEAYSLCKGKDDSFGQEAVDTLLKDCEDNRGKFVCLLAGYPVEMQRFMGSNSGLQRRFDRTINFRDYTGPELTQIFKNMAASSDDPVELSDEVNEQLGVYFDKVYKTRGKRFGNAGTVRDTLEAAKAKMRVRTQGDPTAPRQIIMADIEEQNKNTVEDILASFDDLVGMSDVKEQIRAIAKSVQMQRKLVELGVGTAGFTNVHIILTGNPGTGKTTVAQRLGQVFKAIGIIPTDRVVVKKREDIIDSYANSAGRNMTQAVDDAMGGILFIDEAYNLLPTHAPGTVDAAGNDAVNALMTCMSERAGQFITVIAGYKTEIDEFIRNANPGLERRFTHRIHIPDYSSEDLATIFLQQVKKNKLAITEDAEKLLRRKIDEMVTAKDEKFGNAGTIIKLFEETKTRHFNRVSLEDEIDVLLTINKEDIPYDEPKRLDIDEIMTQLDGLEGLASVKSAVRDLADTLTVMQSRAAASGEKAQINLDHYLFLGNPGTGKTTVARIMGNIFYSLGLLPSNKVVELSAKDLKAPYVGQTSPKAHAAMMRGMGGVVFIDEAYSITQGDGQSGFGQEAVAEILQVMENYKNRFITIAAGYPREMSEWLDSNSGLASRFTQTIMFDDYNAEELSNIASAMFRKKNLKVTEAASIAMLNHFARLVAHKTRNFANAREARNYVDKVLLNQGRRLRMESKMPGFTEDKYYILEPTDMTIE